MSKRGLVVSVLSCVVLGGCGGRTALEQEAPGSRVEVNGPLRPQPGAPGTSGIAGGTGQGSVPSPGSRPAVTDVPPMTGFLPPPAVDVPVIPGPRPVDPTSTPSSPCQLVESETVPRLAFTFSDGLTSIALEPRPNESKWCISGQAVASGPEYQHWGAGLGVLLDGTVDGQGTPFQATELGIVGVRFNLEMQGRPVETWLTETDDPAIFDAVANFSNNPFIWGGSTPARQSSSGTFEIRFEEFALSRFTQIPPEFQRPIAPSRLHAIHFVAVNGPSDEVTDYTVCVSDLEWIDACGAAVQRSTAPGEATSEDTSEPPSSSSSEPAPSMVTNEEPGSSLPTSETLGSTPDLASTSTSTSTSPETGPELTSVAPESTATQSALLDAGTP